MDENEALDLLESLNIEPFLLILDQVQDPRNLGACFVLQMDLGLTW